MHCPQHTLCSRCVVTPFFPPLFCVDYLVILWQVVSIAAFARLNRLTLWKGKMINSTLPHTCKTTAGRLTSNPLAPRTHTPSQKEHWFKKKNHSERIWDLQRSCENKMIESVPMFVLYLKTNFVVYIESVDLGGSIKKDKTASMLVWTNVQS